MKKWGGVKQEAFTEVSKNLKYWGTNLMNDVKVYTLEVKKFAERN